MTIELVHLPRMTAGRIDRCPRARPAGIGCKLQARVKLPKERLQGRGGAEGAGAIAAEDQLQSAG
ncbi:MAG: hypothetical protein CMJ97_04815 [Planctomycetes bacterium]|nr:hypothetical protein [Planctomycetota bacterium]